MADQSKTGKHPQADNVAMLEADFDLPSDPRLGLQPAEMKKYRTEHKAAPSGDVIISLYDSNTRYIHTRVSSKVMCRFSRFFKHEPASDFSKSRYRRSTANPTRIKLFEKQDGPAMATLCDLLHSGLDYMRDMRHGRTFHTHHLVRLAYLAQKYDLQDHLIGGFAENLLVPYALRAERADLDSEHVFDLVIAAFLLHQRELFNVFTRSLIIDHSTLISQLMFHPYFTCMYSSSLIQLEELRFKVCWSIESFIHETADALANGDDTRQYPNAKFALELAQQFGLGHERWPPLYQDNKGHTIREVIEAIAAYKPPATAIDRGPTSSRPTDSLDQGDMLAGNILSEHCREYASSLNQKAPGLC